MSKQLNMIRKENNNQDKQLSKENAIVMTDMVCYLRSSNLCEYDIEIIRKELTGMALEAQLRGESFGDVVGEDYESFCRELIKSGRQKTGHEKVMEILYTVVLSFLVLYAAEMIFSLAIISFSTGKFMMPITLGFVISTLIAVVFGNYIYYYLTKHSFDFMKKSRKTKIIFVVGFTAIWTATLLARLLFRGTVLLTINCFYPIIVLGAAFILIKLLNDRYINSFIK